MAAETAGPAEVAVARTRQVEASVPEALVQTWVPEVPPLEARAPQEQRQEARA